MTHTLFYESIRLNIKDGVWTIFMQISKENIYMDNTITKTGTLKKTAVFSKDMTKRYELTFCYEGGTKKQKSILIICLNPASADITITDTTTNYVLNNLLPMGYTTITICNLYATICGKLKTKEIAENSDNIEYIGDLLKNNYTTVLLGYGNTFTGNKKVNHEKEELEKLLKESKTNVVELVDKDDIYSRLKTIHPLFAGQRFSGEWKFRKYVFHKESEDKRCEEYHI